MTYQVRGVPSALVEQLWKFAEPYIKRALDHTFGEVGIEDLKAGCLSRDVQLWMMTKDGRVNGAATTEILLYPQKKVCRIITLSGTDFDEWKGVALEVIRAWAAEQGCVGVEVYVRKGFVPKLAELGYKHRYSVCHMEI